MTNTPQYLELDSWSSVKIPQDLLDFYVEYWLKCEDPDVITWITSAEGIARSNLAWAQAYITKNDIWDILAISLFSWRNRELRLVLVHPEHRRWRLWFETASESIKHILAHQWTGPIHISIHSTHWSLLVENNL
jgi:hypothetical protein